MQLFFLALFDKKTRYMGSLDLSFIEKFNFSYLLVLYLCKIELTHYLYRIMIFLQKRNIEISMSKRRE
ncbi:hypothetical protein C2L98_15990 [Enterococcus gallinarum]|nr:hypothetical protein C2L98_15990 [Enterococcus gallinarum]